ARAGGHSPCHAHAFRADQPGDGSAGGWARTAISAMVMTMTAVPEITTPAMDHVSRRRHSPKHSQNLPQPSRFCPLTVCPADILRSTTLWSSFGTRQSSSYLSGFDGASVPGSLLEKRFVSVVISCPVSGSKNRLSP